MIDKCGFLDLDYEASPYTWQKHFSNGHSLWERLDRGLATNDWLMKFPKMRIIHLSSDSSNHCPLWIVPDGLDVATTTKPFRFEEMWLSDPSSSNVVEVVGSSNTITDPSTKIMRKIKKCGTELKRWSRDHIGNMRKELAKKKRLLVEAKKEAMQSGLNHRVRELKKEINELTNKESIMWFQ